MDNIEQLLRLTPYHNINLLCGTDGEFQASIYFDSDYATDFCDGIGATYWEALKALDVNLGELYTKYGLPLRRSYEPVATPPTQSQHSEQQDGLSLAEIASCEVALLRYQADILSKKVIRKLCIAASLLLSHISWRSLAKNIATPSSALFL